LKYTRINGYEAELIIDALYYALDQYWTSAGDICPFTVKLQAVPVQDDDVELSEFYALIRLAESLRKFLQRGENNGICPVPVNRKEVQCMMDALCYAYDQIDTSAGEVAVYSNAKGPENQLALARHGYALVNKLKEYNKKHAADSSWNLVIMKDEKWRSKLYKESLEGNEAPCDIYGMLACSTDCPEYFKCHSR
jgi:hypothetical protein